MAGTLARITERSFRSVAARRRAPALHPLGMTCDGTADLDAGAGGLVSGGRSSCDVIVRLSGGIGWRSPLPDFLGVAIRFVDAHGAGNHQDLLLTTVLGGAPVLRHVLCPTPRFDLLGCSTVLPYRASGPAAELAGSDSREDCTVLIGCEPLRVRSFDAARTALREHGSVEVVVRIARPLGAWRRVATVRLVSERTGPAADAVRFDPWNTGPHLAPSGMLNELRRPAYAGSREGASGVRRPT